jgi:hypothetical protein
MEPSVLRLTFPSFTRVTSKEVPPMSIVMRFPRSSSSAKKIPPTAPAAGPDSSVAEAWRIAVSAVMTPEFEATM